MKRFRGGLVFKAHRWYQSTLGSRVINEKKRRTRGAIGAGEALAAPCFGLSGLGSGLKIWSLGFGVWGLGIGVWGFGFGVWGLGFGVWCLGFEVWVEDLGFGGWNLGFEVWDLRVWVWVWGLGFGGYASSGLACKTSSIACVPSACKR